MSHADEGYELRGPDRPELVVALHGLTADRTQPLALLRGLDERWGVLAPDLRGHGAAGAVGRPQDFRPTVVARDVIDLVRRVRPDAERIGIVGISLGATVALEVVRSGALPVAAAVYVRPAHGADAPLQLEVNHVIARLLREDPVTAARRLQETDDYRAVAAVSERHAASLRRKAAADDAARRAVVLEEGSWIAFPPAASERPGTATLILAAERDPLHPVEIARLWAQRLPGAELAVVPAEGGDAAQAEAIGERVRDFLGAPGGTRR